MEITGKLIKKLEVRYGESNGKQWVNQEFVIETMGSYPKKICFQVSGQDRVQALVQIPIGAGVRVTFYPESRVSKDNPDKYFTLLRCSQIDVFTSQFPTNH